MKKIHPAAWVGLLVNIGISFYGLEAFGDMPVFPIVMFGGAAFSAVGIALLAMGRPVGGIIGAIGSAIFVPIGLICLIGCMRTRQELIKDAKNVDSAVTRVFEDERTGAHGPDGDEPAGDAARQTSGTEILPSADFRFKDQRLLVGGVLVVGTAVLLFMSMSMYVNVGSSLFPLIIFGCVSLWAQSRQLAMPALALYEDHLACIPSQAAWASGTTVMYKLIQEAGIRRNKGYVIAYRTDGMGTEKVHILFNAMPSDVRDAAKRAFADKMRERGVPFTRS